MRVGSSRRVLTRDSADFVSSAGVSDVFAEYDSTLVSATSKASRVASMLRAMYGPSLSGSDGLTWKDCMANGQMPPMRIDVSSSRLRLMAGSTQDRMMAEANSSRAHTSATAMRMLRAGMRAFASVKPMPSNSDDEPTASPYRSSQYE